MTQQAKLISEIVAATVLIFGGLTFLLLRAPAAIPNPTGSIVFNDEGAISIGKSDSPVVVRAYGDFQCPACKAVEPAFQAIRREFADRVKFVWKNFPLLTVHPNARAASNASECANAQGKFWEYHDRLYATQETWAPMSDPKDRFVQFAREVGLDEQAFTSCYNDRKFDGKVMDDVREGENNGVNSTPTFYVNNAQTTARTEAQWRSVLNAALQQAMVSQTTPTSTIPTTSSTNSTAPVTSTSTR